MASKADVYKRCLHYITVLTILALIMLVILTSLSPEQNPFKQSISSLGDPSDNSYVGSIFFGISFVLIAMMYPFIYDLYTLHVPKDTMVQFGRHLRALGSYIQRHGGSHVWVKNTLIVVASGMFIVCQYPENDEMARIWSVNIPNQIVHAVGAAMAFLGLYFVFCLYGQGLKTVGLVTHGRMLIRVPGCVLIYILVVQALVTPFIDHCSGFGSCDADGAWYRLLVGWFPQEWFFFLSLLFCIVFILLVPNTDTTACRSLSQSEGGEDADVEEHAARTHRTGEASMEV